jgi:hypothetical protein
LKPLKRLSDSEIRIWEWSFHRSSACALKR